MPVYIIVYQVVTKFIFTMQYFPDFYICWKIAK